MSDLITALSGFLNALLPSWNVSVKDSKLFDKSISVDTMNVSISFNPEHNDTPTASIIYTTSPTSRMTTECRDVPDDIKPRTLLVNTPFQDRNSSEPSQHNATPRLVPYKAGRYMLFVDPSWWASKPRPLDVMPNLRIVPLEDRLFECNSIEAENGRLITMTVESDILKVSRTFDSMELSSPLTPERNTSQPASMKSWMLFHVAAEQPVKLSLKHHSIIVEYRKSFAASIWCLVNHHDARGEEVYLIIYKGG